MNFPRHIESAHPQRWLVLAILTFARASIGFQLQSVSASRPCLLDQFELSYAALGTLIGIYLFPGIALALPGGVFGHRYGDKTVACVGLAAMTMGGLLMARAEATAALTIGRVLSGTGAIFFNVLVTKMVTDWFKGREIVSSAFLRRRWPFGSYRRSALGTAFHRHRAPARLASRVDHGLPAQSVRPERLAIAMGIYFTCHYGRIGLLSAVVGYARRDRQPGRTPLVCRRYAGHHSSGRMQPRAATIRPASLATSRAGGYIGPSSGGTLAGHSSRSGGA